MGTAIGKLGRSGIEIHVSGRLTKGDYEKLVPVAEERIRACGSISLLVRVDDLKGWTASAFWEDLKFDMRHYGDVERLAIVGRDDASRWMAKVARPFTRAEVGYFRSTEVAAARAWIMDMDAGTAGTALAQS